MISNAASILLKQTEQDEISRKTRSTSLRKRQQCRSNVRLVAFDNVASTLLLVWTGLNAVYDVTQRLSVCLSVTNWLKVESHTLDAVQQSTMCVTMHCVSVSPSIKIFVIIDGFKTPRDFSLAMRKQEKAIRRSQHSQECKHPRRLFFCDSNLLTLKINGFPELIVEHLHAKFGVPSCIGF